MRHGLRLVMFMSAMIIDGSIRRACSRTVDSWLSRFTGKRSGQLLDNVW